MVVVVYPEVFVRKTVRVWKLGNWNTREFAGQRLIVKEQSGGRLSQNRLHKFRWRGHVPDDLVGLDDIFPRDGKTGESEPRWWLAVDGLQQCCTRCRNTLIEGVL